MVYQKRSNLGFTGYEIPTMPRGSRSARGRRSGRRHLVPKNDMFAFELLATVAGNLLLEEASKAQNLKGAIKQKQQLVDDHKPFKIEPLDQGSCDEGSPQWKHSTSPKKECSQASTSGVVKDPMVVDNSPESCHLKLENGFGTPLQVKKQKQANGSDRIVSDMSLMDEIMDFDAKPPPLVSSDSSADEVHGSPPKFSDMEMLDRDDDENSSGCTHPSTITTKTFRSQNIGDRRIKKITASKFWKVGPTLLKDGEFYRSEVKPVFRSRKMCCTRQRTQRSSFKRKRLSVRSTISSNSGICKEAICDPKPVGKGSDGIFNGAKETWPNMGSKKLPHKSDKVKFRVKSFKLPELFIEIPESATVGSLKRTVVETVSAMLESGFGLGVILKGKKIWDDNKTLAQAGLSHQDNNLNTLGFTLEPQHQQMQQQKQPQLCCHEDPQFLQPCDSPKPLSRIPALPVQEDSPGAPATPPQADNTLVVPTDHNATPTSKALVTVPSHEDEPLAVVQSCHRKLKRSELVQRRIRRPFSVSEVEALVHAVEILGTGRWRDVKIRAFENEKHRTYVDLKDKWKTLVHTAKISPQQRRGEPVPQELLDRVLKAHAHWTHHQAKLQTNTTTNKPQMQPETCLLV